jgi:hypothetical protein
LLAVIANLSRKEIGRRLKTTAGDPKSYGRGLLDRASSLIDEFNEIGLIPKLMEYKNPTDRKEKPGKSMAKRKIPRNPSKRKKKTIKSADKKKGS